MSGGFFRGTTADQDTRFSNKQAKLLKSQKFSPELEHLVDMTKVKMDVIRPWIATRVTELIGFEDEVLINFIYGLLDGKEVNGKQIQITLTGFMEKNTRKFMKELWALLLSAQGNASGVPQQFLDAKEEETRKKKAEADHIENEIQKKKDKESRELEQERLKRMDDVNERKALDARLDPSSKNMLPKSSSVCSEEERDADQCNGGRRKRVSRSPCSTGHPTPPRRSLSRPVSRSFSNSRSFSKSVSRSPQHRRRSISVDKTYRSSRRSPIPRSRYSPRSSRSPARISYSRQRSRSCSPRRSPSPIRRRLRSPDRYRSRTPVRRRRSPSPVRHRRSPSPVRHRRSPSPVRRRRSPTPVRRRRSPSPVRSRRSPSPVRRRRSPSPVRRHRSPSPIRRRRSPSPIRHRRSPVSMRRFRSPSLVRRHRSPSDVHPVSRSPVRRRSPLHVRRRSPSPRQRRSPSLIRQRRRRSSSTPGHRSSSLARRRSPASNHRSVTPSHNKSPSPSSSASPVQHRPSPIRRSQKDRRSPLLSPGKRQRMSGKLSPVEHRPSSVSYPHRDLMDQRDAGVDVPSLSSLPNRSPASRSPSHVRKQSDSEERRSLSSHESPVRQQRERIARDDSFSPEQKLREMKGQQDSKDSGRKNGASRSRHSPPVSKQRVTPRKVHTPERLKGSRSTESRKVHTPERLKGSRSTESRKGLEMKSERSSGIGVHLGTPDRKRSPALSQDSFQDEKQGASNLGARKRSDERSRSHQNNMDSDKHHNAETSPMSIEKLDHNNHGLSSGSEGGEKRKTKHKAKRKHKRSERREVTSDDSSSDSEIEDRKEAKRRRKEEKKLRKEEKRRRREERHRKREERRAEKPKMEGDDNGDDAARMNSHPSLDEDTETEQKKLEIELRKRALESLKAKKGITS